MHVNLNAWHALITSLVILVIQMVSTSIILNVTNASLNVWPVQMTTVVILVTIMKLTPFSIWMTATQHVHHGRTITLLYVLIAHLNVRPVLMAILVIVATMIVSHCSMKTIAYLCVPLEHSTWLLVIAVHAVPIVYNV